MVQDLRMATDGFRLGVLRRDKGAFSLLVNDDSQPRAKGRDYAPERSIALPPPAIVAAVLAAAQEGHRSKLVNACDTDWLDCERALIEAGIEVHHLLEKWLRGKHLSMHTGRG